MKKISIALLWMLCSAWQVLAQPACIGNWLGTLKIQTMELRVVFRITAGPDGSLSAKMDSPDQGAKDIPVDKVECNKGQVSLTSSLIMGSFTGELSADGKILKGEWKQGGLALPLELSKVEELPEVRRPQNPQKPYPYLEEEVVFENKTAGVKLAGTLTRPKTGELFSAVVLLTGSGPQDRDETIFNHKPFWVLADYLTRQGLAVLRYDDRGIGRSEGDFSNATTLDFTSDAQTAVAYLQTRPEINKKKIGLLGHSEGGLMATLAAAENKTIAFMILLAGPGQSGEEILLSQIEALLRQSGSSDQQIKEKLALQKKLFALLKAEPDNQKAQAQIKETIAAAGQSMSEEDKKELQDPVFEKQLKTMVSPWYRYFMISDPRPYLRKITCPVLALNGEKDLQVPARLNLPDIEKALKAGGNKRFVVRQLAGLNHLFQTCQTGAPDEYGKIEETISPIALKAISDWLVKQKLL